jgi:thiol-disulfide isomerase/thioredoxin
MQTNPLCSIRQRFRTCCLVLIAGTMGIHENTSLAQLRALTVNVIDSAGKPVADAEVEVFEWTGELKPTDFRSKSNADGQVVLGDFNLQAYLYLIVRHPEFAPTTEGFSTIDSDTLTATVRLAAPASNFLRILSPDGKPVSGAEVTRLEYSSKLAQSKSYADQSIFQAMMRNDGSPYRSDSDGRLQLPPLPADAELKITVTHPEWAVGVIENVKLGELHKAHLKLTKGTRVEAYFSGSPEALEKLQGQSIKLSTSDRKRNRLNHSFQVADSKIQFALVPGRYDSMYLRAQDVVITPSLPSSSNLANFAEIPAGDSVRKNYVVRELYKVTGKVVTPDGQPVKNADITISYENLYVNEQGEQQIVEEHPTSLEFVETDSEGVFKTDLPKGKSSVSIYWVSGYYSIPEEMEVEITGAMELPEYVVNPKPTLKGQVVDENGQPVPGAVVRFLSQNVDAPYVIADADASFEFPVTTLGFDYEKKERSFVLEVAAFELNSEGCCIEKIDVSDEKAISNCKLKLKSQPASWLMEEIKRRNEESYARMLASSNYIKEEIEEHKKKQEANLEKISEAPELASGTWLNTDARSLKEFRGKYVLLDFWFIGCGPCERGIPNLKLLHEKFNDQNFSVVGIHIAGTSPEIVQQFLNDKGISYPTVIDCIDESINKAYRPLGVDGYPTYILIDPEGKIDKEAPIHGNKLECIREKMLLSRKPK